MPQLQSPVAVELPLAARKRIDALCLRFEAAWKSGSRPQISTYLDGAASAERSELLCELLKIELHYRRRAGETPFPDHYLSQFPGDEAVIQAGFQVTLAAVVAAVPHRAADTPAVSGQPTVKTSEALAVPGYELLGAVGKGGMGVVYQARQASLNRIVALKMILDEQATDDSRARFRREAESLAQIQHENIIRVFEINEAQGRLYFSMEFIKDGSLNQYLDGKPLPPKPAAQLVETLARAVHAAHQSGVIHRDLKPANILLAFDGSKPATDSTSQAKETAWWERQFSPKITDFGLAKRSTDPAQTAIGAVCGTPSYMAPEQADGQANATGPATDVYSLGAILYELLTGRPPFKAATMMDTVLQLIKESAPPPRRLNKAVPLEMEAICLKCLEKAPEKRYASALELAEDLRRYVDGKATKARPLGWSQKAGRFTARHPIATACAVLLLVTAGAAPFVAHQVDPDRPRRELKTTLAAQRLYVFPSHERRQGVFRQVYGSPTPLQFGKDDSVIVETLSTALWEMIDDPMCDHFSLSAEVRHLDEGGASFVGIYYGYWEKDTPQGTKPGNFIVLGFADRGSLVVFDNNGKAVSSTMRLASVLFDDRQSAYVLLPNDRLSVLPLEPAVATKKAAPWRKLELIVSPEGVQASWASDQHPPQLLPNVSIGKIHKHQQKMQIAAATSDKVSLTLGYAPRGGVGLYVTAGKAAFRNISIKPLPGGG
ncbi:MAG TPA: serine/threonine-protein kinase [Gemmataceae bacterium]|nr:serine/threonine-protein kinase [Gemmataceae bacterium]